MKTDNKKINFFPTGTYDVGSVSLRDFTAIVAMHALISRGLGQTSQEVVAKIAYKNADALLEQKMKTE